MKLSDYPNTDELRELLKRESEKVSQIISETEKSLAKSRITGHVRIADGKNSPQYFYITKKGDTKGRYLKKSEMAFARKVAQHQYEEKLLYAARKWQHALLQCQQLLPETDLSEICSSPRSRRNLVSPKVLTCQELKDLWLSEPFTQNTYAPEARKQETKNSEYVRSKSEKIIADMLYDAGIPYRYECALRLNGKTVFPDFTILDTRHHRIVLWEHLGLLDDSEYAAKNQRKVDDYIKAGYVPGKTLIITSETQSEPLNLQIVRQWLRSITAP